MNRTGKKALSLLLTLCMVLALLPTVTLASGGVEPTELTSTTDVESGKVYTISNTTALAALATIVNEQHKNCAGATFVLTDDIDMSGESWTPIGY